MTKELKTYITGTAAFLAASNQVNASVIYTDINPDTTIIGKPLDGAWDCYAIDIDNDGNTNFSICQNLGQQFVNTSSNPYGTNTCIGGELVILGSSYGSDNYIAAMTTNIVDPWCQTYQIKSANLYEYSFQINSNNDFKQVGIMKGTAVNIADISNGDKYLSVKFKKNSQYHYGWVRIESNIHTHFGWLDVPKITIKDFAYESIANTPILAGQKTGGATGLSSKLKEHFQIFSSEKFLSIQTKLIQYNLRISDISGKEIYSCNKTSGDQKIPINQSGIYLLNLTKGEETYSEKIVIK